MIESGELVGTIRFRRQPELANNALNSASVHSLPPEKSIMIRSINLIGEKLLSAHADAVRYLEAFQRSRGAGACRRLAQVMRDLGWIAVRVRDLTRGGYKKQVPRILPIASWPVGLPSNPKSEFCRLAALSRTTLSTSSERPSGPQRRYRELISLECYGHSGSTERSWCYRSHACNSTGADAILPSVLGSSHGEVWIHDLLRTTCNATLA